MARYDQDAAFISPLPGVENFNAHDDAYPGAGTQGIVNSPPGVGGDGVIANPVVSVPFASSQLAESMPRIPVTAGDTSGMTDDNPAHTSAIDGHAGDGGAYTDSGAGHGRIAANNPNSEWGPGPETTGRY